MGKIKRLVSKKIIAVLIMLAILILTIPTVPALAADNGMVLKTSKVSVWPEYDDPRVLVIFEGTFVNTGSTDFNGKVYFNIHQGAQIGMACEIVNGGGHSCQLYNTEAKGEDTQSLFWKTSRAIKPGEEYPVFLEYYYNPIKGATDKTIDYNFLPSYKIEKLDLSIQQPLKAEKFSINPAALSTSQDSEGFTNHNYTFTNKTPNDKLNFKIAYTKTDPNPSKLRPANGNTSQQSIGGNSSGESGSSLETNAYLQPGVLIPGLLFLVILVAFIIYANSNTRERQSEERIKRIISKSKTDNFASGDSNEK